MWWYMLEDSKITGTEAHDACKLCPYWGSKGIIRSVSLGFSTVSDAALFKVNFELVPSGWLD